MRTSGGLQSVEANSAAWEGGRGALIGAAKWGAGAAILGAAGYAISPIYRGLTIQFKVFLQMSGMILGSCLEADHRIRQYEAKVRMEKRMVRDRAAWEQYEQEYGEVPPPKKSSRGRE
ncbi:hypothetical protein L207DRAFT_509806 [Hyaloscypha variabilis F]|uniref:Imidazoleglycerol-phosphate dehydratase n=1 Tax=Hyaloscypha variabilis (strain UAMH 11265 / GT02V1 / F) TaxID=1149755 RepID=A0A2J6RXP4_HYAVF|nr:hypothetical protein L207DRAFT_509806 [Hyaloscypha variabilis F]